MHANAFNAAITMVQQKLKDFNPALLASTVSSILQVAMASAIIRDVMPEYDEQLLEASIQNCTPDELKAILWVNCTYKSKHAQQHNFMYITHP